tara:strand:+ start:165 stop:803 length:639 start_codon:yes stop_codon:yes gene_type:complete
MKVVSVILARGGSKGIPDKNIIDLGGVPLISYSINASLASNVDETWVSTDSKRIATLSVGYGSKILMRPVELATDTSSSELSLLHFAENVDFDILVFIQPTSPMINKEYINKGINLIKDKKYDSVFTSVEKHWTPTFDEDVNPIGWEIGSRPMRQQMPKIYEEVGMFYITTKELLLETKMRYGGNIGMVEIPLVDGFQIDSMDDLSLIEKIL